MNEAINKISSYNILNNILPGAIFCYLYEYLFGVKLLHDGLVENIFIIYFIGMCISRIGSLVIEPLLKKCSIVKYTSDASYIKASKDNQIILALLETRNLYRTMSALGIVLLSVKIIKEIKKLESSISDWLLIIGIIVLFTMSYVKQAGHIRKRVINTEEGEN